jgi:glucose/arabinose dehydrogenase
VGTFAFDPQGRLWLSAAGLEAHAHDGVYVLAKPGGEPLKVIGGLDDPLGLAWYRGRLYVASVGRVDAFGGFNGRRFSTRSEILRGPVTGAENNNLVIAPSGRLLMGVTATCDHCTPTSKYSGAIVSFLANGSELNVYAGRIRAPVGLTFAPGTSELFTTMNQRDDLGARTPGDWLALVREGQSWGFPACFGQGGSACAGVPQPIAALDRHAAVGGVAIAGGALSPGGGTSAIVAEWQTGRVQQVALTRSASGYTGKVSPFLSGIRKPIAVTLAPDGSLLVGDWETGTIYRIAPR